MSSPNLSFRANTQKTLQEAADQFKQNKIGDANHILHEGIFLPWQKGHLSDAQAKAVYRSIIPDPLASPETPFSKRQCIPAMALKAMALRDLVQFSCAEEHPKTLRDGPEKQAIVKAAELLETLGDEVGAWKILHEALPNSFQTWDKRISEEVIVEVYRIMFDSFRIPTSPYLKRHVDKNPLFLDTNRLRAKALESLSTHLFDQELKANAIKDLVKFYAAASNSISLQDGPEKTAILKAAELLGTSADEAGAWRILQDALPSSLRSSENPIREEIVKEVYKIMLDSTRSPTSSFLRKQVQNHSSKNVSNGSAAPSLARLPKSLITQNILPLLNVEDLGVVAKASKSSLADVKKSLKLRTEITLDELRALNKMNIIFDKNTFPALHCIRGKIETNEDVHNLLSILSCANLDEIDLDAEGSKIVDRAHANYLTAIGELCPNLLKFAFRNSESPISIDPVVRGCKKLQTLHLSDTQLEVVRADRSPVQTIAENCPDLISFEVSDASSWDLKCLVDNCKNLTHIALLNTTEEFALGDQALYELSKCRGLQSLSFWAGWGNQFSLAAVRSLVQGCKAITHLEFENCQLGTGSLAEIGAARLPLKSLVVNRCGIWRVDDFEPLAAGLPDLEVLRINKCYLQDDCLQAIGKHCHKITTLDLSEEPSITSKGVKAIAKGCPLLTDFSIHCNHTAGMMKVLAESGCRFSKFNVKAIDRAECPADKIIAFVKKNPGLTHLNLSNYDNVDDNLLIAISEFLPNLASIDLKHTNVTHIGLAVLGKRCPKIKRLNVAWLKKFNGGVLSNLNGDLLLEVISKNFSGLTNLEIAGNRGYSGGVPNFSYKGFVMLGKGCPDMEELDVSSNNLTMSELRAISNSFFHLKYLNTLSNYCEPSSFKDTLLKNSPNARIFPDY